MSEQETGQWILDDDQAAVELRSAAPPRYAPTAPPPTTPVARGRGPAARRRVAGAPRADKAWQAAAWAMRGRLAAILGSDPPARDVSQAFWHACTGGQRRAAEYLLSRGADLN